MTNWVNCMLIVVGKQDRLREFMEYSKGHNDTYGDQALQADRYPTDRPTIFYDVSVNYLPIDTNHKNCEIIFSFYSNNSPPNECIYVMSQKYNDLIFKLFYVETVNGWSGEFFVVNEYVIYEIHRDDRVSGFG